MLIQCTTKLLDELKIKPVESVEQNPLFAWHAHLVRVNHRKTVVLMNDKSRYVVIMHGLKAKNFRDFDPCIREAIGETLQAEGIKEEIIEQFLGFVQEITYNKTKDRSLVARLNNACEHAYHCGDLLLDNSISQSAASIKVSRLMVSDGKNDYTNPNEDLYQDLQELFGPHIFGCSAVEIEVTLELENQHVWRRLIVPLTKTFTDLHDILQVAFGWKDYHLHEFYIYSEEKLGPENRRNINHPGYHKDGYKAVLNIVHGQEEFESENHMPIIQETGLKLSQYMPANIKYNYDYGDNWQHYIKVVQVIENYETNYPVCLAGAGNAPPEDVGGDGGYHEFLRVIGDPTDPDHKFMLDWGKSQGYGDFDLKEINRRLKLI